MCLMKAGTLLPAETIQDHPVGSIVLYLERLQHNTILQTLVKLANKALNMKTMCLIIQSCCQPRIQKLKEIFLPTQ